MTTKEANKSLSNQEEKKPTPTLVPPDGGWGWFIVVAYVTMGIFCIPIIQTFGLLYKDYFETIGLSATDTSVIINTNSAISMCTGLINGPILNKYGFRKVSVVSSVVLFIGLVLTSRANSFAYFMVSYSIIAALGLGPLMSAQSLAINTYFKKKRSKATGYAMTGIGMGPIFMPFLITYLLSNIGVKGTGLIQAALSLHSMIGGILLQPVKWHMKKEIPEAEAPLMDKKQDEIPDEDPELEEELIKHEMEVQSIYGIDTPAPERRRLSDIYSRKNSRVDKWLSTPSINTINLGSSYKIFEEEGYKSLSQEDMKTVPTLVINHNAGLNVKPIPKRENWIMKALKKIFYFFDLDLLRDPYYLNLLAGMSVAMTGEINFSLLTPFILADFHLNEQEIATVMAVVAILDIIFRFIAPYIGDGLKFSARVMYMISMVLLILSRMSLLLTGSYISILCVAGFLGIAKGIRTVYMALVIPAYVPLERLASASGIQMLTHGIVIVLSGPLMGYIRDVSGSYRICIVVINLFTFTALLLWSTELLWVRFKRSKKKNETT